MIQQAQYRHIDSVIPMLDDILNKHIRHIDSEIPMLNDILTSTVLKYWECNSNVRWHNQQVQHRHIDSVIPMLILTV